jgi:hypothetical protein
MGQFVEVASSETEGRFTWQLLWDGDFAGMQDDILRAQNIRTHWDASLSLSPAVRRFSFFGQHLAGPHEGDINPGDLFIASVHIPQGQGLNIGKGPQIINSETPVHFHNPPPWHKDSFLASYAVDYRKQRIVFTLSGVHVAGPVERPPQEPPGKKFSEPVSGEKSLQQRLEDALRPKPLSAGKARSSKRRL